MRGRLIVGLVLGAAITGALIAAPASATPQTTIKAVVIGDSYSAGTGGGSYTDTDCYRSDNSWAQHYVDWLNTQPGVSATLQNLACKGATTDEIADQVDQIPADTNLVMLTAGGNDANFSTLVENCFVPVLRSGDDCKASMDEARADLPEIQTGIQQILTSLDTRLSDDATVIFSGYPLLSTDDSSYCALVPVGTPSVAIRSTSPALRLERSAMRPSQPSRASSTSGTVPTPCRSSS